MFNKIGSLMKRKSNKREQKPQVQYKDNDGNILKKNVEDLSDSAKLALLRIEEISKDKQVMQKNLEELDVLHIYYSNKVENEIKEQNLNTKN